MKGTKFAALSAASILAFAASAPAGAQVAEGSTTESDASRETQAVVGSADIVVTAQRRAERVQDVPLSITVATQAQLERQQVNTVSDLSRVAPSLEISQAPGQSVGGGGQIRGIGTQSFQQGAVGSVGIVVDGVSQGNANISDLFDISRVEVLKGPQGTLFGLTTSAGVISISTTAPQFDKVTVRARTELSDAGKAGSEYGRQLVQGVVNLPLASNAALRVSGNMNLTQGVNRNTLTGDLDPHRTYGGRARLLWEPTSDVTVNLIGDYTKVDDDGVDFFVLYRGDSRSIPVGSPIFPPGVPSLDSTIARCGVTPGPGNRDYCSANPGYSRSETWGASLQVDYEAEPFTITSITAYRDLSSDQGLNIFRLDPLLSRQAIPPGPAEIFDGPKPIDNSLFTQELRFASPTGSLFEYTAGLFFSHREQNNGSEIVRVTIPLPFQPPLVQNNVANLIDIRNDTMAAFGQTTIHVSPQFRLIAGGRYTAERLGVNSRRPNGAVQFTPKSNINNFSWRLGAQYEFSRELMTYATAARGYKGPQIALPAPNAAPGTPPVVIDAEIPTAYEIGVKASTMGGRLGMELSGFYTDTKDFQGQQCQSVPAGGILCAPQNISGVVSKGVEFSVNGRPAEHVSLNLGAIWNKVTYPNGFRGQDGSDLGKEQLANAPEWKVTASGEVVQPIRQMEAFIAADAVYKSEVRLAASTNPLAIYGDNVTLGGRLGVRGPDGMWTAAVFARNLTNNHEPGVRFLNFPDGTGGVGQILTTQSFRQVGLSFDLRF